MSLREQSSYISVNGFLPMLPDIVIVLSTGTGTLIAVPLEKNKMEKTKL